MDTKSEGSRKEKYSEGETQSLRSDLRSVFLGGALELELSEAEKLDIERFMQTLLNLRCTKLGAGNDIYECIIFKTFYLITQPQ